MKRKKLAKIADVIMRMHTVAKSINQESTPKAVCEFCARDFTPKPNDGEIGKRFCSVVCYESAFTHGEVHIAVVE